MALLGVFGLGIALKLFNNDFYFGKGFLSMLVPQWAIKNEFTSCGLLISGTQFNWGGPGWIPSEKVLIPTVARGDTRRASPSNLHVHTSKKLILSLLMNCLMKYCHDLLWHTPLRWENNVI